MVSGWGSGNGVGHINEVKLRRARLVLGLAITCGGSNTLVFIQTNSAWPSLLGRCNEYWRWFRPPLGRNGEFCVAVGPVSRTAGIRGYCILAYSGLTLACSNVKGDELPYDGPNRLCINILTVELF